MKYDSRARARVDQFSVYAFLGWIGLRRMHGLYIWIGGGGEGATHKVVASALCKYEGGVMSGPSFYA